MENNIIQCPYCLKESQKGVHVCTGCQATILYGAPPGWCVFLVILGTFIMSILIGLSAGIVAFNISLFVIAIFGFIISKLAFSERISFRRRM
ncbi:MULTISPECIES: hypothetical protein [Enterobacteriaceae]|jgi:hypothetical protein|uniref:Transmembrane protein n=1 Tax=Salmonella enterica TaxID=28901 RepID=A0A5Y4A1C7_SALER|nr:MULTISPECIES: hypothetical protein [Enterobacteriaceae]ECJ9600617.1 hypothetical protein [Salmonella enterica]EDQ5931104.1 hypothetical protein [Salmonella enterica subsp. enterica serovar Javiana]HDS2715363.1 hypothetical protein [Klebsiella pneumoniae subsp. pneumoniae]MDE9580796.1 hypothetical protein [Citrobacter koseri]QCC79917.1 hypothetical protein D1Y71_05760 [Klebsiella pneumoniae]